MDGLYYEHMKNFQNGSNERLCENINGLNGDHMTGLDGHITA